MQPPSQHSRINLSEFRRDQIVRKLGPGRSKQYFHCLKKLLGLKLSKVEFHKICLMRDAPLGIPFCAASTGGAHRSLPLASSSKVVSLSDIGGLFDATTLGECMKQIAASQGSEGVSLDSANILNNGLDAYKRLIRSSMHLWDQDQGMNKRTRKLASIRLFLILLTALVPVITSRCEVAAGLLKSCMNTYLGTRYLCSILKVAI